MPSPLPFPYTSGSGRLYFRNPVKLRTQNLTASFQVWFQFQIIPTTTRAGDGFALFLAADPRLPSDAAGGALGLVDNSKQGDPSNHLFAVEFLTYPSDFIRLSVNGLTNYYNATVSDFQSGLRKTVFDCWIFYENTTETLEVSLRNTTYSKSGAGQLFKINLRDFNISLSAIITDNVYVGFSAATGDAMEEHIIYGSNFSTWGVMLAEAPVPSTEAPVPSTSSEIFHPECKPPSSGTFYPRCKQNVWNRKCKGGCAKRNIIIVSCASAFAIFAIITLVWIYFKLHYKKASSAALAVMSPTEFTYKELAVASKGFSDKQLFGTGGFGKVFKGTLKDGCEVAIKVLSESSQQGEHEFAAELSVIGRLRHRNIVGLKGWCHDKKRFLLVYEYMANGSLDKLIFPSAECTTFPWMQRWIIIKGVAEALTFLHEGWEQKIIH